MARQEGASIEDAAPHLSPSHFQVQAQARRDTGTVIHWGQLHRVRRKTAS